MDSAERDITSLLRAIEMGDDNARGELFAVLYDELRARAAQLARHRGRSETMRTTAIVHETYLRMARGAVSWNDRAHFLATAAKAMRHVLIDQARARKRRKRQQPPGKPVPLDEVVDVYEERAVDLEALNKALQKLATFDPTMAQAVELRFFGGASVEDTARMLGLSKRTLERRLKGTSAWLHGEVTAP